MRVKITASRPASVSLRDLISRAVRGHAPSVTVERRQIPYWQERGWTRQGNVYTGNYQTAYAAFCGQITEHPGGHIDFMIYNPSGEIRRGSHWACFQHRGNEWYLVHMSRQPKDVSSGLLVIERLITEAYET